MGKLNMDKMLEKQDELKKGSSSSNYDFDKLVVGKNVRRILPPKGDSDEFFSEGYMHFNLGADGKTAVTCLETFDKKCPICEYLESIKNSNNKEDKDLYSKARKSKRIYINVLNRDSEEDEEVPKVLPIGKMILKQIIDIICDPDYGDITDFDEGRDITITRSGTGINTEYSVLAKPRQTPASTQYDEDELDKMLPDLDSMFVEKSEDELNAILSGEEYIEDEEDADDEDDDLDYEDMDIEDLKYLCKERGISYSKTAKKSRLVALLNEYDEDEEETEDEDDEYDNSVEDEDDEDDDSDELMKSVQQAVRNRNRASSRRK